MPRDGFLEALPSAVRQEIESRARTLTFGHGDRLFLTGDDPVCAFVVLRGVVKLVHGNSEGREMILAVGFPGRVVGLGALLLGECHRHDACAMGRGTALALTADTIGRLITHRPACARVVNVELARWAQRFEDAAIERGSRVSARVAGRLLDLAAAIGTDGEKGRYVEMPMPFADLARLSATSRETVSKTLHRFRREGLIDFRGRTMRIQRPDMLERIRCGARASEPSR